MALRKSSLTIFSIFMITVLWLGAGAGRAGTPDGPGDPLSKAWPP